MKFANGAERRAWWNARVVSIVPDLVEPTTDRIMEAEEGSTAVAPELAVVAIERAIRHNPKNAVKILRGLAVVLQDESFWDAAFVVADLADQLAGVLE